MEAGLAEWARGGVAGVSGKREYGSEGGTGGREGDRGTERRKKVEMVGGRANGVWW